VLLYVVILWRLGMPAFWDPDEAHYAQTTREMLASGDWLAPHFNGEPFFDKPALFHVLQGVAMHLFGPTEFAARIVPALAALVLIGLAMWLGNVVASPSVGLVSGLVLTVSPGVFALARYAILDMVFTAFLFAGAALVTIAMLKDRAHLQWPGFVCIALAVLTKGPVALVLCGLTLLLACVVSPDIRTGFLRLRWAAGGALIAALTAPWFVLMYPRFGQRFVDGYVLDENIRLFAGRRFGNQPPPWFYLQLLATGLLPWTGIVVGRAIDDIRALVRRQSLDHAEILLWMWVIAVVGFFSTSTFRLDHYIFPAAPALALLCARGWSDARRPLGSGCDQATRVGVTLVGPVIVVLGAGLGYFVVARLDLPGVALIVPIVIAACGAGLTGVLAVRRHSGQPLPEVPWLGITAMAVAYVGVILFVIPALDQRKAVRDLGAFIASHASEDARVASYRLNRNPAFRFYANRHVEFLEDSVEAERFFTSAERFYCAMRLNAAREFMARGVPLEIVFERDGMLSTSGRALWRWRAPPVRFVIVVRAGLPAADAREDPHALARTPPGTLAPTTWWGFTVPAPWTLKNPLKTRARGSDKSRALPVFRLPA